MPFQGYPRYPCQWLLWWVVLALGAPELLPSLPLPIHAVIMVDNVTGIVVECHVPLFTMVPSKRSMDDSWRIYVTKPGNANKNERRQPRADRSFLQPCGGRDCSLRCILLPSESSTPAVFLKNAESHVTTAHA